MVKEKGILHYKQSQVMVQVNSKRKGTKKNTPKQHHTILLEIFSSQERGNFA